MFNVLGEAVQISLHTRCLISIKNYTRNYTKDKHKNLFVNMRMIWCENCRVVKMQFKQTNGKWE